MLASSYSVGGRQSQLTDAATKPDRNYKPTLFVMTQRHGSNETGEHMLLAFFTWKQMFSQ